MLAIALGARTKRGSIGARPWFGQAVTGKMLHCCKFRQIAATQFVVGKAVDHPRGHVVDRDVGRRGRISRGEFLKDERRIQPRECRAPDVFAHIDTCEALFGSLAQGIHGKDVLFIPQRRVRKQLRLREGARGILEGTLIFIELEVHVGVSE